MALDPSMPVLVVDDYSTMVRIIRNLLHQLGFSDVDDANDGAATLAKMRAKRYGLVISDWNMEPMSGYELLLQVRADPALGETPFIMVTAESKTDNVIAARKPALPPPSTSTRVTIGRSRRCDLEMTIVVYLYAISATIATYVMQVEGK